MKIGPELRSQSLLLISGLSISDKVEIDCTLMPIAKLNPSNCDQFIYSCMGLVINMIAILNMDPDITLTTEYLFKVNRKYGMLKISMNGSRECGNAKLTYELFGPLFEDPDVKDKLSYHPQDAISVLMKYFNTSTPKKFLNLVAAFYRKSYGLNSFSYKPKSRKSKS